ncbi:hypothetical protein GCM10009789_31830 [Kribbella sancticallisti]|uniref:Uncharacterized protein n=1 Tax=Kribbella sancticallisti TaxID=460087 RepID=A0ABP4PDP7_9ACTN
MPVQRLQTPKQANTQVITRKTTKARHNGSSRSTDSPGDRPASGTVFMADSVPIPWFLTQRGVTPPGQVVLLIA